MPKDAHYAKLYCSKTCKNAKGNFENKPKRYCADCGVILIQTKKQRCDECHEKHVPEYAPKGIRTYFNECQFCNSPISYPKIKYCNRKCESADYSRKQSEKRREARIIRKREKELKEAEKLRQRAIIKSEKDQERMQRLQQKQKEKELKKLKREAKKAKPKEPKKVVAEKPKPKPKRKKAVKKYTPISKPKKQKKVKVELALPKSVIEDSSLDIKPKKQKSIAPKDGMYGDNDKAMIEAFLAKSNKK
jgi:hypothetical protein